MPIEKRKPLSISASMKGMMNGRCSRRTIFKVLIPLKTAVCVKSRSRKLKICARLTLRGESPIQQANEQAQRIDGHAPA